MKRCLLAILLTCALSAVSYGQTFDLTGFHRRAQCARLFIQAPGVQLFIQAPQYRLAPVQVAPVQRAIQVPAAVNVQTVIPTTTLRWGLFKKRLVPKTTYQLGPVIQYQLQGQ